MTTLFTIQLLAGATVMAFDNDWRSFGALVAGAAIVNLITVLKAHKKRLDPTQPTPPTESVVLEAVTGTLTAVGLGFAVRLVIFLQWNLELGPASSLALAIFAAIFGSRLAGPLETWWKNRLEKPPQSKDKQQ